jgi:hypothetical protein
MPQLEFDRHVRLTDLGRAEPGGLTLVGSTKHALDEVVDPEGYPGRPSPDRLRQYAERSVAKACSHVLLGR